MLDTLSVWLEMLGFSSQDRFLLALCPLAAALGGFVHVWMLKDDYSKLPKRGGLASPKKAFVMTAWLSGRLILSAVAGLVLALYFVGALTDSPTTVARILAFAILIGYAAPRLWVAQEQIVAKAVEDRMRAILNKHGLKDVHNGDGGDQKIRGQISI